MPSGEIEFVDLAVVGDSALRLRLASLIGPDLLARVEIAHIDQVPDVN